MKIVVMTLFLGVILLSFTAAKLHPQQSDETEKLKAVLNEFFNSINTHDIDKFKSTTTNDFILYEDGRLWNIDSAVMNIKRNIPFSVKYQMSNLHFFIDSKSADVNYTNRGDFTFASGKLSLDWVESATFRKINGKWKINFLSATVRKN